MNTITKSELESIMNAHKLWVEGKDGGKRADLCGAALSGADLRQAQGAKVAACHWTGHGERGRLINAVEIGNELRFFCGCFQGNEQQLRNYIAAGEPDYVSSRTKALEFLLSCFDS